MFPLSLSGEVELSASVEASVVSNMQVQEALKSYLTASHLTSHLDVPPGAEMKFHVSDSSTRLGALAEFWKVLVDETDRFDLAPDKPTVILLTFADNPALASYTNFSLIDKCIDFTQQLCLAQGHRREMVHFHPNGKPGRRAPFPTLMITLMKTNSKYTPSDFPQPPLHPQEVALQSLGPAHQALVTSFEHLYNRAASSSSTDRLPSPILRNALSRTTTPASIITTLQSWLATHTGTPLFCHAVDTYHVSEATHAEEAYVDAWRVIEELAVRGRAADKRRRTQDRKREMERNWSTGRQVTHPVKRTVVSAMLVTPVFMPFNAEMYKRYSVTITSVLSRLTDEKMTGVMFHPEYVCGKKGGGDNVSRRTAFPCLQFIWEVDGRE